MTTTFAFGNSGCTKTEIPRQETYLIGNVKGEVFERQRFSGPGIDRYSFSLETDKEVKTCRVLGEFSASKIDSLINPGDKVKILLDQEQNLEDGNYAFEGWQFKEVNGKAYKFEF